MSEPQEPTTKGYWSTGQELVYIRDLGKGIHSGSKMPERKLLQNYLDTMKLRRWDPNMDVKKIRKFCKERLGTLR